MKTLQNNFTTPEQSKRLLELGVPADSADMWWEKNETIRINGEWVHGAAWDKVPSPLNWDRDNNRFYTYSETKESVEEFTGNDTLPCWSVGRLMEIANICSNSTLSYKEEANEIQKFKEEHKCETLIEAVILCITDAVSIGGMDLSKLEE